MATFDFRVLKVSRDLRVFRGLTRFGGTFSNYDPISKVEVALGNALFIEVTYEVLKIRFEKTAEDTGLNLIMINVNLLPWKKFSKST